MKLYDRDYTRGELLDAIGDVEQLGGVTPQVLTDGPAAGTRIVTVRSPGGLSFVCLPDRGLDLGWADHRGMPLAWRSPLGDVGPSFAEHAGQGWMRTFAGGLITTCGLMAVGQPSTDQGEAHGLHGRYSCTPVRNLRWSTDWFGDQRVVTVRGTSREGSALGPVLELQRTITTMLGSSSLSIEDVVTNIGAVPAPHMFRYHVNLGFPVVERGSRIHAAARAVHPRDAPSEAGLPTWDVIGEPSAPTAEQVFTLEVDGPDGQASATVAGPEPRPSLRLRWSSDTLPLLLVWKQPTRRTCVTALEPSNCRDGGRAAERAAGTLVELAPGEQRRYLLEFSVGDAPDAPDARVSTAPVEFQGAEPLHRRRAD